MFSPALEVEKYRVISQPVISKAVWRGAVLWREMKLI